MNDNENRTKINKLVFGGLALLIFAIPFIIYGIVYGIGDAPVYEKKDVLAYYGSIIGACFGGFVTAAGLYYTLQQNAETFNTQRAIDQTNREEDKSNSVMPVFKFNKFSNDVCDMYLKTNHEFKSTISCADLKIAIKNIGVGPALNVTVKINEACLSNLYNLNDTFDLGVGEIQTIKIKTYFDKIEYVMDGTKYIDMTVQFNDVYKKRIYKYYIKVIKGLRNSQFETFSIESKEIVSVVE